jgi:hypothetical protein
LWWVAPMRARPLALLGCMSFRITHLTGSSNHILRAFQHIVHCLSTTGILAGDVRIGMTPFSWRAPHLTARIMRDCLSHLFFAVRNFPRGNTSLHVSVRSLTEFRELTELVTRDLPVRYGPLGFPLTPWIPDDGEVRELAGTVRRTLR